MSANATESKLSACSSDRTNHQGKSVRAWLTLSAVTLAVLIVVQAGRLPLGMKPDLTPAAYADLVSLRVGDQSMMTFNGGNDDVLMVLDSRAEQIVTYRVRQQQQLELLNAYSLPEMFSTAQRMGVGGGGGGGRGR